MTAKSNPEEKKSVDTNIQSTSRKQVFLESFKKQLNGSSDFSKADELVIGRNHYAPGTLFPNIPDEIVKSRTGNYYIIFDQENIPGSKEELLASLALFNKTMVIFQEDGQESENNLFFSADAVFFYKELGFAFTSLSAVQVGLVAKQPNSFALEPEHVVQGVGNTGTGSTKKPKASTADWGIQYIKANGSIHIGAGVKVAVLDTGFDISHPDFANRKIVRHTFINNLLDDDNGHGMHCAGIAYGDHDRSTGIRYGVASGTDIYSCKILDHNAFGVQHDIVRGILWAVRNGCKVILLSVEIKNNGTILPNTAISNTINYARRNDCLVVAAAGNNSNRSLGPMQILPIGQPADAQLALAVGAIDNKNNIYNKSNRADLVLGQHMSLAAPGVNIYSSWSTKARNASTHRFFSGTSMAAPFVAGVVAQLWEKNGNVSQQYIVNELFSKTRSFSKWKVEDTGKGVPLSP